MTELTISEQALVIGICALATMTTRFLPFLLFRRGKEMPPAARYLGRALPAAVFVLLIVYCLKDVSFLSGTRGVPELAASAVTAAVHLRRRNMMLSMTAGTFCYMFLIQVVFP